MRIRSSADAIQAGRLGLWLLSRRAYRAKNRRRAFPRRVWVRDGVNPLIRRFAHLAAPWSVSEYPGAARLIAGLIGVELKSARTYLKPSRDIPPKHAPRLIHFLEARVAEEQALIAELREYHAKYTRKKSIDDRNLEIWKSRNRATTKSRKLDFEKSRNLEINVSCETETPISRNSENR